MALRAMLTVETSRASENHEEEDSVLQVTALGFARSSKSPRYDAKNKGEKGWRR